MKKLGIILLFILFAIPMPFFVICGLFALMGMATEIIEMNYGMVAVFLVIAVAVAPYGPIYIYALLKTLDKERVSFVTFTPVIQIAVTALLLVLVNPVANLLGVSEKYFGLRVGDYEIVESLDTHGGFHGDGTYRLILDCSKNREKALKVVSEWDRLPLPENVDRLMFGNGSSWDQIADEAKMPRVENGYYVFQNRSPDKTELDKSSYIGNFTIAVYDTDTDMMYYFEWDT